mmetsp:Transcript_5527/g.7618  ORF Transcript_5527/g.7618 Transcript_5527/m.7618 type:complete len:368 (-) Transcript_5527:88-1191(-)
MMKITSVLQVVWAAFLAKSALTTSEMSTTKKIYACPKDEGQYCVAKIASEEGGEDFQFVCMNKHSLTPEKGLIKFFEQTGADDDELNTNMADYSSGKCPDAKDPKTIPACPPGFCVAKQYSDVVGKFEDRCFSIEERTFGGENLLKLLEEGDVQDSDNVEQCHPRFFNMRGEYKLKVDRDESPSHKSEKAIENALKKSMCPSTHCVIPNPLIEEKNKVGQSSENLNLGACLGSKFVCFHKMMETFDCGDELEIGPLDKIPTGYHSDECPAGVAKTITVAEVMEQAEQQEKKNLRGRENGLETKSIERSKEKESDEEKAMEAEAEKESAQVKLDEIEKKADSSKDNQGKAGDIEERKKLSKPAVEEDP